MNRLQLVTLVRNYQQHLAVTGSTLSAAATRAWDELGSWDEADLGSFTAALEASATAVLSHAQALAAAFVAMAANLSISTAGLGQPSGPDWTSAFQTLWGALENGRSWDDAFASARGVVDAISINGVQDAARQTTSEIDRNESQITRWFREPDANACDWCLTVAEQTYSSAESADFGHDRCGCSVVPA